MKDNNIKKIEAVVEKVIPTYNITVKAKANSKYDVAFLFKRALWGFEKLVTVSAGLGVNNFVDNKKRKIEHGIQLDINI